MNNLILSHTHHQIDQAATINKGRRTFNEELNKLNLIDINKFFYPSKAAFTFFSCAHETLLKYHIL